MANGASGLGTQYVPKNVVAVKQEPVVVQILLHPEEEIHALDRRQNQWTAILTHAQAQVSVNHFIIFEANKHYLILYL